MSSIQAIKDLIEGDGIDKYIASIESDEEVAEVLYQLGSVFCRSYGDLDSSDLYYGKAIDMFDTLDKKERVIDSTRDLAVNQELRGNYDEAYELFYKCTRMSLSAGYYRGYMIAFGGVALLYFHLGNAQHERVLEIDKEFKEAAKQNDNPYIIESIAIADGLLSMNSNRLRDLVHSQNVLEHLIETTEIPEIKFSSIHFLVTNYIKEMMLTENLELLPRAKELFNEIQPAMEDNLILKIRFNILEAKLQLVNGDLEATKGRLNLVMDELNNLQTRNVRFEEEVLRELDGLNEYYDRWRKLVQKNISFEDEIKQAALEEYFQTARRVLASMKGS